MAVLSSAGVDTVTVLVPAAVGTYGANVTVVLAPAASVATVWVLVKVVDKDGIREEPYVDEKPVYAP